MHIDGWFERFGAWLMVKTGNSKDKNFIEGFVCVGAVAIIGSIEYGISSNISILAAKAIPDFVFQRDA